MRRRMRAGIKKGGQVSFLPVERKCSCDSPKKKSSRGREEVSSKTSEIGK